MEINLIFALMPMVQAGSSVALGQAGELLFKVGYALA